MSNLCYSQNPDQASKLTFLEHQETIDVLNIYADTITSNSKVASDRFHELFQRFIELFEKSGYQETYLDGESTEVTDAYEVFLGCFEDEVTEDGVGACG